MNGDTMPGPVSVEALAARAALDRWRDAGGGAAAVADVGDHTANNGADHGDRDGDRAHGLAYYLRPVWYGYGLCFLVGLALGNDLVGFLAFCVVVVLVARRWDNSRGRHLAGRRADGAAARAGAAGAAVRGPACDRAGTVNG